MSCDDSSGELTHNRLLLPFNGQGLGDRLLDGSEGLWKSISVKGLDETHERQRRPYHSNESKGNENTHAEKEKEAIKVSPFSRLCKEI